MAKRRTPVRARKAARRRLAAPKRPPSRVPAHRTYSPELLANARRRYEETPEPVVTIAADLGVHPTSVYRLAQSKGWVRRNVLPQRDLSPALRLLEQARALEERMLEGDLARDGAAGHLSPHAGRGRPPERSEGERVRGTLIETGAGDNPPHPHPLPARAGERSEQPARALEGGRAGPSLRFAPLGGAASGERERTECAAAQEAQLSAIERLERATMAELATIEAMRAELGAVPQRSNDAARTVRSLSLLTQTMQHLQRMRAAQTGTLQPNSGSNHDDDIPADIDEFRRDLARRIDAFVESRTGAAGADGNPAAAPLDDIR